MADTPFNPFADGIAAEANLTQAERQQVSICSKRAAATSNNRATKKAEHAAILDQCDGDREAIKTITLWVPINPLDEKDAKHLRYGKFNPETLRFAALDRKLKSEIGNDDRQAMTMIEESNDSVQYKLVEREVPRARHYDEEIAFARLQNRFRESKPSILGFFHKPTTKHGDRRQRNVLPAPLGSFEWCDRDEVTIQVNAETRAQRLERSLRKIRNVKESLA